jgi:hypothetical protein
LGRPIERLGFVRILPVLVEGPPKRASIDSIRASLMQVSLPEKATLLDLLLELERKAK